VLRTARSHVGLFAFALLFASEVPAALAQSPQAVKPVSSPSVPRAQKPIGVPPGDLSPQNGEHPLQPLIRWGRSSAAALKNVQGYTCTLVKRERIEGELGRYERLELKVRHEPFSVYLRFPRPEGRPWQEVIFVEGQNNGMMWAHSDHYKLMGTASLYPDGRRALLESRYPLTQAGILNLIERLVEVAQNDARFGECEVKIDNGAKIEARPCLCVAVTHPTPRKQFSFHHARVYIDSALHVPVRYESYHWPRKQGEAPLLLEEYTYLDYKFDAPLIERDFDIKNPAYFFPEPDKNPDADLATE
jgi:Protein of unknown function (DUF1571)